MTSPTNPNQYFIIISGHVQGVFFRKCAEEIAIKYRLLGWIRNNASGQVEALIQGNEDACQQFISWCYKGSPSARVSDVHVKKQALSPHLSSFTITP